MNNAQIHAIDNATLAKFSAGQMLELYNQLTGQSVKRFSDRASALRRTTEALEAWKLAHPASKPCAKSEDSTQKRAVAAAGSWSDPQVRAMRCARLAVVVDGTEYSSTANAFREMNLQPFHAHIKFRALLRESKVAVFKSSDGREVRFELVAHD